MKTIKLLSGFALIATLFTSCYTEVLVDDYVEPIPSISLNQMLNSYELWYVDINETIGYGNTPYMQMAFTLSFRNGVLYANNNLVGFGSQGNGYGIPVGDYDAYNMILDVYHDIDGYTTFDVYQIDNNTIELYNPNNDTSYFLNGYQRSYFDYDFIFYDNIHYFLQEYEAWEKTYTSEVGAINEFDNEKQEIVNPWRRIELGTDLPKERGDIWVVCQGKVNHYPDFNPEIESEVRYCIDNYSYWKKYFKPQFNPNETL